MQEINLKDDYIPKHTNGNMVKSEKVKPLHSSLAKDASPKNANNPLNLTWGPSRTTVPTDLFRSAPVSLFSRLKNLATNLNYSLSNSTQKSTGSSVATLLGTKINTNIEAEVKARITKILWFSYRDKISPIMEDVFHKGSYTCDRGWGCMLRAGQMMLGQAIKSHLNYSFESETDAEDEKYNIISLFADTVYEGYISPFSIHQISRKAYEYFGLKPGEWYKPSNIMVTLSKVKDQFDPLNLQNLKICICLDGTVFEDQIADRVFNNKPIETNGTQEKKNESNPDESDFNPEVLINNQWDNSLLLFIATKTGLDEHNPLYLNTITKLLSFKESIGMLGGKGSRAFYFIGLQNSDLLYFDPHYVQDAASDLESLKHASNTYSLNKCFQINIKDIDTSVGFGFYIRDQNEYKNFRTTLYNAIKQDPNFLVGLENVTPTLDLSPDDVIECKEDGSFEVIE